MPRQRFVSQGQLSLFATRETPDAFRKAVQVVHSQPKSPLSLLHRKIGNAWLKHAIESQPDNDGWWELSIKKLAANIGFNSNNRQYLKESAEALMRVVFEWDVIAPADKRVQWKASVLFPEIEIRNDAVRYQISSQMRERMINPEIYALIDMNVVRRFRRASSLAIWEFCVRFERIGKTAEVEWQVFRDIVLGESQENSTYLEYKYFKSKVVNPAVAEINSESNHTIGLVEEKIGKRVATIRFDVDRKAGPDSALPDSGQKEVLLDIVALGVPQSEARRLLATHPAEQCREALDYTRRRMAEASLPRLTNPAAYFRQALNHRYGADSKNASPPAAASPARPIDIKEIYAAQQLVQADHYFRELDAGDQLLLVERYNAGQSAAPLRLGAKATKLAQAAFFRWLAQETWGEPGPEELLEFAQGMLAGKHAP
ncbi:MAG TPA: replication initiation protein [Azonexus sp.]